MSKSAFGWEAGTRTPIARSRVLNRCFGKFFSVLFDVDPLRFAFTHVA
jgi:hypothetical protein